MLRILYRMLENPKVYDLTQKLLGGDRAFRAIREAIVKLVDDIGYNDVLDVGCGTGLFSDCFKDEYTGIDINPEYIKKASLRRKGTFLVADATALPFEQETFDLIFTLGVLHHLNARAREQMLNEVRRVCKKGGHILIIDGLVPSNRLNVIGYILAKLDRGEFKMRIDEFKEMIVFAYPDAKLVKYAEIKSFPHEFISVILRR